MLESQAVPLDELVAPLSKDSVILLVAALNKQICDQMDVAMDILKGLNIEANNTSIFDEFLQAGYLLIKSDIVEDSLECGVDTIDYFRQKNYAQPLRLTCLLTVSVLKNLMIALFQAMTYYRNSTCQKTSKLQDKLKPLR